MQNKFEGEKFWTFFKKICNERIIHGIFKYLFALKTLCIVNYVSICYDFYICYIVIYSHVLFCAGIKVEDVSAGGGIEYGKHEGTNHKIHFIIVMGLHKII